MTPLLPLTRATLPEVHWLVSTPSTNTVLRQRATAELVPHGSVVATANQTAGRGRQDRTWVTPPGLALSASILVRADWGAAGDERSAGSLGLSWLPLLAGSAITQTLQPLFRDARSERDGSAVRVGVKWPNDVHVRDEQDAIAGVPGAKVSGVLCEVLPSGEVIVGFGINLLQEEWELPTERAGSVRSCGGDLQGVREGDTLDSDAGMAFVDRILARAGQSLLDLVSLAHQDPEAARGRVRRDSLTIGAEVRVHLPGGDAVDGRAVGFADDGALIVDRPTTGQLVVSAADVEHLR